MKLSPISRFCAPELIAFDTKALSVDGQVRFTGKLAATWELRDVDDRLLTDFAGTGSREDDVLRFLRLHGPLLWSPDERSFSFARSDWIALQEQFRFAWGMLVRLSNRDPRWSATDIPEVSSWRRMPAHGVFVANAKEVLFLADNLFEAMRPALLFKNEAARECANPACEIQRYFFATHMRQSYCSEVCAEWAQSEAKKRWWKEKGRQWHAARNTKKSVRGRKSGTKKAR